MEISMDGSDPATWDPALDAVLAAPENHKVLYEDDLIRVISVRVAPGATEKPHHHRFPAVFVIDRMVKLRDFNGITNQEISLPIPEDAVVPITLKFAPQPLHYVENLDTKPFHATRIEFKQGLPGTKRWPRRGRASLRSSPSVQSRPEGSALAGAEHASHEFISLPNAASPLRRQLLRQRLHHLQIARVVTFRKPSGRPEPTVRALR